MFDSEHAEKTYEDGFPKYYKHKTIMRFSVGPYQFANHLLQVDTQEADDDFLREVRGLLAVDQINIVEVLNIENERPVDSTSRIQRGSTASHKVGLSEQSAEARSAELDRREQEIVAREALLVNREAGGMRIQYDAALPDSESELPAEEAKPLAPITDSAPKAEPASTPAPAPRIGGIRLGNNA